MRKLKILGAIILSILLAGCAQDVKWSDDDLMSFYESHYLEKYFGVERTPAIEENFIGVSELICESEEELGREMTYLVVLMVSEHVVWDYRKTELIVDTVVENWC